MTKKVNRVWEVLESDPAQREALQQRSDLMIALCGFIQDRGLPLAAAATALGTTPNKAEQVILGKINALSLDELEAMANHAGLRKT